MLGLGTIDIQEKLESGSMFLVLCRSMIQILCHPSYPRGSDRNDGTTVYETYPRKISHR